MSVPTLEGSIDLLAIKLAKQYQSNLSEDLLHGRLMSAIYSKFLEENCPQSDSQCIQRLSDVFDVERDKVFVSFKTTLNRLMSIIMQLSFPESRKGRAFVVSA